MSFQPCPIELEQLLEQYSHTLEDLQGKFNPFFSKVSLELKSQVDELKANIELYANYHRSHQLKHLIEAPKVRDEIRRVHKEAEKLSLQMRHLEKMFRLGQNLMEKDCT